MKAFLESQLGYCPLVWMFHSRSLNNKINRMHERALRMTHNDKSLSFRKLLEKDNFVTIHHRNIKVLATRTYKFLQGLSWPLVNNFFMKRSNNYSLWGNKVLTTRRLNSMRHGNETVSRLALKVRNILPKEFWISWYFQKMHSKGMLLQNL